MPTTHDRIARILSGPTPLSVGGANPAENLSVLVGRNAAGKVGVWVTGNRHPTQATPSVSQTTRTPPMPDDAKTPANAERGARSREVIHKPTAPSTTKTDLSDHRSGGPTMRAQHDGERTRLSATQRATLLAMLDRDWTTEDQAKTMGATRCPASTLRSLLHFGLVEDARDRAGRNLFDQPAYRLTELGRKRAEEPEQGDGTARKET